MARVIASVLMAALALGAIALTGGGELSRVQTVFGMNTASGASTAVGANATPMVTATTGGPMVVLGLGDSVMAGTGCGCDGIPEEYSAILRQRTGRQVTAVNEGVPGATSADLLADLKDPGLRSEVADADVIIVSIGANDMVDGLDGCTPSGCAAQSASQAAAMKSRVDAVLTQLRALRGGVRSSAWSSATGTYTPRATRPSRRTSTAAPSRSPRRPPPTASWSSRRPGTGRRTWI